MSNPPWVISLWLAHFPVLTHTLHRHHSLAAGKTLGTRLNFSTPGKFLLGHFGRGGGTGLWRESATFCAPPCRGSRSSLKAAPLRASELPPGVQRATAPPALWTPLRPCDCGICRCSWWPPLLVSLQYLPKVSFQDPPCHFLLPPRHRLPC